MYIAVDDTYGPSKPETGSRYITGGRRTHVAVVFADKEAEHIRNQVRDCLAYLGSILSKSPTELHFADIYNRRGAWKVLDNSRNLFLLEAFAHIYQLHRWKIFVQTIDNYTLRDHPSLGELPAVDGLDPANRADLSLLLLCLQIRTAYKETKPPIHLIVDQGRRPPNSPFGTQLFHGWGTRFSGKYDSSSAEPLLQIADFMSFCINRSTYLSTKQERTATDDTLLGLIGGMDINCDTLKRWVLKPGFTIEDIDAFHREDRVEKGLE